MSHRHVGARAVAVTAALLVGTIWPTLVTASPERGALTADDDTTPPPAAIAPGPATGAAAAAAPIDSGEWGPLLDWGVQAKHMVTLSTGKVLVWSTGDNARVWDPTNGTFTLAPATFADLHCAGQATLPTVPAPRSPSCTTRPRTPGHA
jgi:hypothetical protein